MQMGDLVVVSDGNSKFRTIGRITGQYEHLPLDEEDDEFSQSRAVRWLKVSGLEARLGRSLPTWIVFAHPIRTDLILSPVTTIICDRP